MGDSSLANLSIVVLSYGVAREAESLIEALLAGGGIQPAQVLEVHNPSRLGERVRPRNGQRLVNLDSNTGYAGGMNAGLSDHRVAQSSVVLLLTHDVLIDESSVLSMCDALETDAALSVVGPALAAGGRTWSAGKRRDRFWRFPNTSTLQVSEKPVVVDSIDGSVLMLRRSCLSPHEGFDPHFFMYFEETDLLERLKRRGGRVAVVTSALAQSEMGAVRRPRAHAYLMARNGLEVARRHGGTGAWLFHSVAMAKHSWDLLVGRKAVEGGVGAGAIVFARLLGIRDFLLRRFGPPPARVADGDLRA